jgi:ribosomal protein L30E
MILEEYKGKVCANADIDILIKYYPVELAYALALIGSNDYSSITPPWLLKNYPKIENVIKFLCNTPCKDGCEYCNSILDIHKSLKSIFGFDNLIKCRKLPKLVLVCSTQNEKVSNKVANFCKINKIDIIKLQNLVLGNLIKRDNTKILGILDENLCRVLKIELEMGNDK